MALESDPALTQAAEKAATKRRREAVNGLGTWESVDPTHAAAWFSSIDAPWWFAGGWALDLHLGRQSRPHADLDVGILRRDISHVRERLAPWDMFEAKDGVLTRLAPAAVPRPDVHSLWCRPSGTIRWTLELMLDESVDDVWVYRRNSSIRRALSTVIRRDASGLPYLAPEVQLLYKSRHVRPRDHDDFELIAPVLDAGSRDWLMAALERCDPGHSWISALRTYTQHPA